MKLNEYDVEKCEIEKNIFEKRYKTRFLSVRDTIKNLNILNNVFSNSLYNRIIMYIEKINQNKDILMF